MTTPTGVAILAAVPRAPAAALQAEEDRFPAVPTGGAVIALDAVTDSPSLSPGGAALALLADLEREPDASTAAR